MSTVHVRVSRTAATVHVSVQDDETGAIRLPRCGAPGNTPAAFAAFRPVVTTDAVTCKRCAR